VIKLAEARPGSGQDRPGQDRPGQDRPGQDRPGQDRPGQERPGQERPLRVRLGGADDMAALAAIDGLVNESPWSLGQFETACNGETGQGETALVADWMGLARGFVVFTRVVDEACIHNIAVHPQWQGKGCASALLSAALAEMTLGGAVRCCLEVRASNTAARRLYEKFLFQVDGLRKNYYPAADAREDAVLMSKRL
jgi:[ribosomal protein S18]-alanine N-acetyltransferase